MAVVPKNFVIKQGLEVRGSGGTINGSAILTKSSADQNYIVGLIGGSATALATPDTVVLRDENGSFAANVVTADLVGDVTGNVTGDVTGDVTGTLYGSVFAGNLQLDSSQSAIVDGSSGGSVTVYQNGTFTGNLTGNVTGTVSDISNHTTSDLTEGTNKYFTDQRALDATSSAYDAAGSAATAEANAIAAAALDATTKANAAESNAIAHADALTTSDIDEGTNLYFTEARVHDSLSANNGISYDGNGNFAVSVGSGLEVNIVGELQVDTTEIATKTYVDSVAQGLDVKESVRVASTQDVPLTQLTPASIDGVSLVEGDRILLKNQSNPAENGIYVAGSSTQPLFRAADANEPDELNAGTFVFVEEGTTYGDTGWVVSSNNPLTIGTDPMVWTQFSGAGTYLAGNGLTLTGNEFAIDGTVVATQTDLSDLSDTLSAQIDAIDGSLEDYATVVYVDGQDTATLTSAQTYTNDAINALTTDDIEEGIFNRYFTEGRAKASAIDLLINDAQKQNISFESDGAGGLIVTAENGVADSNTDDLAEGSFNLYFTEGRVHDAITAGDGLYHDGNGTISVNIGNAGPLTTADGVLGLGISNGLEVNGQGLLQVDSTVIQTGDDAALNSLTIGAFNAEVNHGSYQKTTQTGFSSQLATMDTSVYSAEEVVLMATDGTNSEIVKLLIAVDSSDNISVTQYGQVTTAATELFNTITPVIVGTSLRIEVETSVSATVKVSWTAL